MKILDFGLAKIEGCAGADAGASPTSRRSATDDARARRMGTVSYMSPEQARGQLTDARTDLFSLGTVLYQMASGVLPFQGDTSAVIFEAILNRDPAPATQVNPPSAGVRAHFGKGAGEGPLASLSERHGSEDRPDPAEARPRSGQKSAARRAIRAGPPPRRPRSVAVLYFENLSGVKEDEYFRDGITEDIITELSKIKGLNIFSRPTVLAYRDKAVTPAQIGQQLSAAYVLAGSLRRSGNRLRINAQLVDTHTDFPLWSERYDREMKDVFEVQDEIARKIAEALRVTLSPQEQEALAAKPTDNLQAYDLYLRGKSYARRLTRQDLEFALQMFENAVALDPEFALALRRDREGLRRDHYNFQRDPVVDRARAVGVARPWRSRPDLPEAGSRRPGSTTPRPVRGRDRRGARRSRGSATARGPTTSWAARSSRRAASRRSRRGGGGPGGERGGLQRLRPDPERARGLGKKEAVRNIRMRAIEALERHLKPVPEDARARILLASDYAAPGRYRGGDSGGEPGHRAAAERGDGPLQRGLRLLQLEEKAQALAALKKAWEAGFRDADWARRDPDLARSTATRSSSGSTPSRRPAPDEPSAPR